MYIKETVCISPQMTFSSELKEGSFTEHSGNKYFAIEPSYDGLIAAGALRRMGKAVRMGVAAGTKLLQTTHEVDGIIIGTANGGLEDCIKFLNQIVDYEEGTLTPTNFVQSTPNAIAGQLALSHQNTGYNITHAHGGHSFENALIDASLLFEQKEARVLLVGAVEEISDYNYNIDCLSGVFKTETVSSRYLLSSETAGTVNGEGAAMFLLESSPSVVSQVRIRAVSTVSHAGDERIRHHLLRFLDENHLRYHDIDGLVLGYNGDIQVAGFYSSFSAYFSQDTSVFSFKNACGEYATASSFAVWLGVQLLQGRNIPAELVVRGNSGKCYQNLLIINQYRSNQCSFILLDRVVSAHLNESGDKT